MSNELSQEALRAHERTLKTVQEGKTHPTSKPPTTGAGKRRFLDMMRPRAASTGKKSDEAKDSHLSSSLAGRMGGWRRALKMTKAMSLMRSSDDGDHRPRYVANSYRTDPVEKHRFSCQKAEEILQTVLREGLEEVTYNKEACAKMSVTLAEDIRQRLKLQPWERYKYVTYVMIGENRGQGINCTSRGIWNVEYDRYATATYRNDHGVFAVATCYATYFE